MRKVISVITAVILLTVLCMGCSSAEKKEESPSAETASVAESTETASMADSQPDADEIIEQIITYHGNYDHEADNKVAQLLEDLKRADKKKAALWTDIMNYWEYVNADLQVNLELLPDGLPEDDSMCIVVLGYQLNPDGTMQDELLKRLEVALACADQYPDALVACTGGGTAPGAPQVTEGGLMGQWMREHGLEEERLIIEDKSYTTAQNAEFTYNIFLEKYPQVDSVAIVSSSYHIPWGALMFEAAFMKHASENETPEIHVISNASCPIENDSFRDEELLRWQTGGMLQLVGNNALASQYYQNTFRKPEL